MYLFGFVSCRPKSRHFVWLVSFTASVYQLKEMIEIKASFYCIFCDFFKEKGKKRKDIQIENDI